MPSFFPRLKLTYAAISTHTFRKRRPLNVFIAAVLDFVRQW